MTVLPLLLLCASARAATFADVLAKGYSVRGTLRSLKRAEEVRGVLAKHDARAKDIEFVAADVTESGAVDSLIAQILDKSIAVDDIRCKVVEGPNNLEEVDELRTASHPS